MTLEMQAALNREMNDALAIEDADRRHDAIMTVLVHQNDALIDCQRKTADRVKQLVAERDAANNKREGMRLMAIAVKTAISIGGPTAAIAICKLTGILCNN